ncbi:hypothetical protein BT96DRAFT_1005317 [Gymnopus androsaceus JB14]|uniref:Uncharacterized protein n=1 Tax=Gymnopus androsaceus JB14 TaxID=1447944 RepID=A0A6A4GP51_9AGAR|nr:hypothetical protein BT96DRAFT_1005317 [Gymnopus androsaceus JB14]
MIGLYVLLDWEKEDYVFIDTGIKCVMSSNWSCILFERNIVIHCEDSDAAFQHFYPLSILEGHARQLKSKRLTPTLSGQLTPFKSIVKRFVFPAPKVQSICRVTTVNGGIPITVINSHTGAIITVTTSISVALHTSAISSMSSMAVSAPSSTSNFSESSSSSTSSVTSSSSPQAQHIPPPRFIPIPNPNPFPFPPWYPESTHFSTNEECELDWVWGEGEDGGRRGFAANGMDALNGGVVNGNGSADGGATAGSSTDSTPSSKPMGPMEMYLLDGPPEDSILAPFSNAGAGPAGSSSLRMDRG